jgi:alkylhydroperoxidase family enzyme
MARLSYATPVQFTQLLRERQTLFVCSRTHRLSALRSSVWCWRFLPRQTSIPRLRELVILRVAQRSNGRYAWVQHVAIAESLGVDDVQIAALERGETPSALFIEQERIAFTLADEVLETCRCEEHTFAAVRGQFSPREILELLLLIGYFRMICGVMTTLGSARKRRPSKSPSSRTGSAASCSRCG